MGYNQYFKNGAHLPTKLQRPSDIISYYSSFLERHEQEIPIWSAMSVDQRRDGDGEWPKWLTDVPNTTALYDGLAGRIRPMAGPLVHWEPIGFDEVNQPGKRSNEPWKANALAYMAMRFTDGVAFHGDDLLFCRKMRSTTYQCAVQFINGCKAAGY